VDLQKKLGESKSVQQFLRDADETEAWMSERLQTASDESYRDPTDLQVSSPSLLLHTPHLCPSSDHYIVIGVNCESVNSVSCIFCKPCLFMSSCLSRAPYFILIFFSACLSFCV